MKGSLLWSIIGLSVFGVSHGGFRHHLSSEAESSPAPATTEPPKVNVSSALSNYEGLNIIHDEDTKTLGIFNVTENVGVSFTNHEGGDVKLLIDSKTGHVLTFQHLDKVTLVQNNEFRGDVLKVSELIQQNYVSKDSPISGTSSEIESSSEDALSLWSEVYLHLGHPKDKESSDFRSLKFVQKFLRRLKHLYSGSLKGLIVGKGPFPLKQNLNRFLTISIGLHELFSKANGGLKAILAKDVKFEVNSLLNARNGAEVLVYVFRQTGKKFDLSTLWGGLLNNIEDLLDILGKLGGGESKNGVDETFALIAHFWSAARMKLPITDFIQFLFESSTADHWSQADDGDLQQVFKDVKNITDEQSQKYDSSFKVSGFVKFFTNLTVNSLIENNVNISELVEKWRKRDIVGGFKTVTHITLKLFSPEKYSNIFFNSFTAFLNATSDPEAVKNFIPGVPLGDISGKEGSVWDSISKSYKIDEQLKKGGDPNQILNGIPVFNEFSKIYKDALGNNFDFSKALNGGTFSEFLSKNPFLKPLKFGGDIFSKFIKESGKIITQIFIDPIKHFIPLPNLGNSSLIPNLSNPSLIPNLPFLQPGIVLPSTEKSSDEKESRPTTKVGEDDDAEEKVTRAVVISTKTPGEDLEDKETESTNKENPTASSSEPPSTEEPTTPASLETHLTASVSPSSSDDNSENQKTTESSEYKASTQRLNVEGSISADKAITIDFRHHHRHHVENRHHGHRSHGEHHRERNDDGHVQFNRQNLHHANQNKHDTRKHHIQHDKRHQETIHHSRRHNHEEHQNKQHEKSRKHENHELKHHHRVHHAERHHSRNHQKQEEIQRN